MTEHRLVLEPLRRWLEELEAWAIPEEILARAPESPWEFPVGLFRARAEQAQAGRPTPSSSQALRFLPAGGTVLDVGAGGGAASLPLAGRASRIVAGGPLEGVPGGLRGAGGGAGGGAGKGPG